MKAESHLLKAEEIEVTINFIKDDPSHVSSLVELVYGCVIHYLAYGCEKKFGRHLDTHVRLQRFLREKDESEIAAVFGTLDSIRHGRWYGGKGNGDAVEDVVEILEITKRWVE